MFNKNKYEFFFFRLFAKLITLISFERIKYIAKPLALLFYYVIPIRKKIVITNLSLAFPEYSKKRIEQITFENYYNFACTFLEMLSIPSLTNAYINSIAECDRLDLINETLSKGKGMILFTAHFGNWELGAVYYGIILEKQITILAKRQRNRFVANWLKSMREKFGNREIMLGVSVRELFRTLNGGGIIGIVGDQRGPRKGMRVNFFNRPTAVFPGAASIAIKNNSPIMVVVMERQPDHSFKTYVEEIPLTNLPEDKSDKPREIIQRYMTILENHVRRSPAQWFWMHNIWKY
ncbi:MAG: hypothetical protein KJ799_13030 [Bacteroidetes bacterium]|nr:hypothetical protein [Bacteroidota bacterium]MBU1679376.1 hypothetical protein [Bacteroidota bacterium]MBU2507628.1 hypothetical protein [Bacteroidota bacterium]